MLNHKDSYQVINNEVKAYMKSVTIFLIPPNLQSYKLII